MLRGVEFCLEAIELFVEHIYRPLFERFGLGTFVLLFFPIYFSLRFLLLPLISGRGIQRGSDNANSRNNGKTYKNKG